MRFLSFFTLSAAATAVIAQSQEPSRELETQQHIVGCIEVVDRARAEHERTDTVVLDVTLEAVDAVLHRSSPHLTADKGFAFKTLNDAFKEREWIFREYEAAGDYRWREPKTAVI